jgi:hypothetical protein
MSGSPHVGAWLSINSRVTSVLCEQDASVSQIFTIRNRVLLASSII